MARMSRRSVVAGLTAAGLKPCTAVAQQAWPGGQTIRIVVPFAPGGSTDIVARVLADRLTAVWSTSVVVENIGGAGANLGNERVAHAPADGRTILMASPSLATNQFLYARLGYDPERDLVPLSLTVLVPNVVIARKGLSAGSISELIALAKANPGKLTFAHSGIGTSGHLSGELFKRMTGTELIPVAYRGGAPALNDVLAESVDLNFANLSSVINQIRAGAVKGLGITTLQRSSLAPELATVAETVAGFESTAMFGIAMRAGTAQAILDKVEADVRAAARNESVRNRLTEAGNEVVASSAAEFAAHLARERDRWGKLITELKIKLN